VVLLTVEQREELFHRLFHRSVVIPAGSAVVSTALTIRCAPAASTGQRS
jgi:hypothetical protein